MERLNLMQDETPRRKRKRLKAAKIDEIRYLDRLDFMQTEIGWDNLLQGKLAREWRIYQTEYEAMQTRERKC